MILKQSDHRKEDLQALRKLLQGSSLAEHRERIEDRIRRIEKGVEGERQAARLIDRSFSFTDRVAVWHDLRLPVQSGGYMQIDHLLYHRHQRRAWVLETKNHAGQLHCNAHGDWSARYGKQVLGISSPYEQAKRNAESLWEWCQIKKVNEVETFIPVVLVPPTSLIDRAGIPKRIHLVKYDQFNSWWEDQLKTWNVWPLWKIALKYQFQHVTVDRMREIGAALETDHKSGSLDWRRILHLDNSLSASTASGLEIDLD